jgi:alpha-1,2-mannosyltransferase
MNRLAQLLRGRTVLALWAGAVMWMVWIVGSILGPDNLDRNGQVIGTDHTAFHTAALLIADGRSAALFAYPDLTEFRDRQEEITGKPGFLDPYRNPPFYALLYLATARLPYLISFAVWAVVGLIGLVVGLILIRGTIRTSPAVDVKPFANARVPIRRVSLMLTLAWALSFYPTFAAVSFGQNTLLSFAAFGLVYRCLTTERRFLAGLSAGLLLYKPQLLFGLGVWWLLDVRRAWPSWLGLASTGSVFMAISVAFVHDETREWVHRLPDIARYDAFEFYNLHNCRGFGALLLGDKAVGNWFGLAGLVLSVGWLGWVWKRHARDVRVMFAATVFATLWGSPHTMTYEWALVVIPAVLLLDGRPDLRETWLPLFAIVWVVMFIGTPLTKGQLELTKGYFETTGVAIQVSVPVLAFVAIRAGAALRTQ